MCRYSQTNGKNDCGVRWSQPSSVGTEGQNLGFLTRVFRGTDLVLPLFHIGILEVGTTWDPEGLPAAYPSVHRYLTREQETRNALSQRLTKRCPHGCTSCHSEPVLRNYLEPLSTPTRSVCEHSQAERQRDKNNAQPSKCMSWTWFGIVETNSRMVHKVAKRPSYPSAVRRNPSNSSNRQNEERKFRKATMKESGNCRQIRNTRFRCVHESSDQEILACLFWVDSREKNATRLHSVTLQIDLSKYTNRTQRRK